MDLYALKKRVPIGLVKILIFPLPMKMVQEQPHGRTDRAEEAGSQGKWFPAWAPTCGVTAFMWCSPPPAQRAASPPHLSSLFFSIPYPVLLLSLPFSFYSFSSPPPTALFPLIIPPPQPPPHPPSSLSSCSSTLLAVFSELGVPPGASVPPRHSVSPPDEKKGPRKEQEEERRRGGAEGVFSLR